MAKVKPTKMLAVLGRCRRTGRWRVAPRSQILAVLGTCNLDMRRSFVDDDTLKMNVTVLFGSATFLLPDGAEVRPSGVAFLASSLVDVPEHDEECELPMIEIDWTCMFGRIRIVTEKSLAEAEAGSQPEPEPEPEATPEPEPEPDLVDRAPGDEAEDAPAADDGSAAADEATEREPVGAAAA